MFGDIEIEKNSFFRHKRPIFQDYEDIEKALISNKISPSEKNYNCFIGYLHNDHEVKPLHIMLLKTSVYVKSYDGQTKWMHFLTEDDRVLKYEV